MSEETQIECIREVFKILVDQCNRYSDCLHCPFEAVTGRVNSGLLRVIRHGSYSRFLREILRRNEENVN